MTTAVVTGAGGFLGSHMVKKLKQHGYWVRGVSKALPQYETSHADEYLCLDLREETNCYQAIMTSTGPVDEVYTFSADMGGIGHISFAEAEILRNNALIDIHLVHTAATLGVKRYFFSSSVCVYRDMEAGEKALTEEDAIPAHPDNEYGWEKLYAERVAQAYAKKYGLEVRIARSQNTYGPLNPWTGGREKAPAAICRKVAEAPEGGTIEVWGDGTAIRSYTYVDDLINGIYLLMQSDLREPVNIGSPEYVSVKSLVETVIKTSGKHIQVRYVPGPIGVQSRNFSNEKIYAIGWEPQYALEDGIQLLYPWIAQQVDLKQAQAKK